MTDDSLAGAPAERGRRGGRAGKREAPRGGASISADAQAAHSPFRAQPRAVSEDELGKQIHLASLRMLAEISIDVLHGEAREIDAGRPGADVTPRQPSCAL